jgi:membrane protease YdiL (CAAX protease family)
VAEEALFRRLLYGLVEPRGTGVAIVVTAVCFAAVHVTVWGAGVLPLDLAAGLLLGWQRAATGDWTVPAVTHVAANLLAVL